MPASFKPPVKGYRLILLTAAFAVVATPGTAFGARDHLACSLTHPSLVKGVYDLPHVKFKSSAASPTAPPPEDHTVAGADESTCDVWLWSRLPGSFSAFGKPPHYSVAACCGAASVTTWVQDEGQEGELYEPNGTWTALVKSSEDVMAELGGDGFQSGPGHKFGASRGGAFWFGSEQHVAAVFYQVHDSFIEINIRAHTNPRAKLWALAHHLVPAFAPYG